MKLVSMQPNNQKEPFVLIEQGYSRNDNQQVDESLVVKIKKKKGI
jgi:hypothetical protein